MKFYADAPALSPVRWYRVRPGGPVLPFCHSFMQQVTKEVPPRDDPLDDQVGVVVSSSAYDKGAVPGVFRPNGHFVGSSDQWLNGSRVEEHPNLDWSTAALGASRQCLDGLDLGGDVMWWKAEDAVAADGARVDSVPDASGYGHALTGVGNSRPFVGDAGDGVAGVGFAGLQRAALHEAPSVLSVAAPPALNDLTVYAVLSGVVGSGGHAPGCVLRQTHLPSPYLVPGVGPSDLAYRGPDGLTAYPVTLDAGRHLYRLVRASDFVSLAVDGEVLMQAGYVRGSPLTPSALAYSGATEVPIGNTYVGSLAFLFEMVVLPFAVQPGDPVDRTWTDYLLSKYLVARGADDVPLIGSVIPYAGVDTPAGWLECNGALVDRITFALLFGRLGTQWGAGDGVTTFALPDLRGRFPRGAGTGPGLSPVLAAVAAGGEDLVLSVGQLPAHGHAVNDPGHAHAVNDPGHAHGANDGNAFLTNVGSAGLLAAGSDANYNQVGNTTTESTGVTADVALTGITLDATGSGDPVATLPPYVGMRYLIYAGA